MNAKQIGLWLRQGSTIIGISTLVGAVCAVLSRQMSPTAATPVVLGAIAAILLPEDGGNVTINGGPTSVSAENADIRPPGGSKTTITTP